MRRFLSEYYSQNLLQSATSPLVVFTDLAFFTFRHMFQLSSIQTFEEIRISPNILSFINWSSLKIEQKLWIWKVPQKYYLPVIISSWLPVFKGLGNYGKICHSHYAVSGENEVSPEDNPHAKNSYAALAMTNLSQLSQVQPMATALTCTYCNSQPSQMGQKNPLQISLEENCIIWKDW